MPLVDSHAHLDMGELKEGLSKVLERAETNGVKVIVTVGIDRESSREAVRIARENPNVYATVGIHPHNAKGANEEDIAIIEELAKDKKVVAYGEIGLDFFKNFSPKKEQIDLFLRQLEVAERLNLPVVIHERDSKEELYPILRSRGQREDQGVIHCFSEDLPFAKRVIELGYLVSIPGIVTFKKAENLREVAQKIPLSSLLLETDAPFLAPEPFRGKTNEPSLLLWTAMEVARLRGISLEELAYVTSLNAKRLFKIDLKI